MTHRSLRLCAILGAIGIVCMACALTLAASATWDAARRGDLPTLTWGPAR